MRGDMRRPATPQEALMRNILGGFEALRVCLRRPEHAGFWGFILFAALLANTRKDSGAIIILGASPARWRVAPFCARTRSLRRPKLACASLLVDDSGPPIAIWLHYDLAHLFRVCRLPRQLDINYNYGRHTRGAPHCGRAAQLISVG